MKGRVAGQREPVAVAMWQSVDLDYPSITARCDYLRPKFVVTARHESGAQKTASFDRTYEPLFGMDVADQAESFELASKLADQLAKKFRLRKPSQ